MAGRSVQSLAIVWRAVRVVALFGAIGLILYMVNESNFVETSFASPAEARAARPGVPIPEWLPESAHDIRRVHNLDTWKMMVRFEMPRGTEVSLPKECRGVDRSEVSAPPMSRDWWPGDIPVDAEAFYQCIKGQFVALGKTSGYVWGVP